MLDDMICNYFMEKDGVKVIKHPHGFAFYLILKEEQKLLITDMYVEKSMQGKGYGSQMLTVLEEIARHSCCKQIFTLVGDHKKRTGSLIAQLKRGFVIQSMDSKNIYLMKEVK